MINTLFILTMGLFSNANDFNCVYTVSYQPLSSNPKYIEEVREANLRSIKSCEHKNPCTRENNIRITYEHSDVKNISRKIEQAGISRAECATRATRSCRIARQGVLASKTVEATYNGEVLFKKICKENNVIEEVTTPTASPTETTPATKPAASKSKSTQ